MKRTSALALVVVAAPAAQQRPTFHATANTVVVQATVLERHGRLIPDLTRDDFEVWEDGKRRPITAFAREQVPVSIAILLDLSGSVRRPVGDS